MSALAELRKKVRGLLVGPRQFNDIVLMNDELALLLDALDARDEALRQLEHETRQALGWEEVNARLRKLLESAA